MMQRELKGKRILITGASSGIGREVAMASAAAGARLLLTSNQPAQLRLVADELAARTHAVIHVPGDITSPLDRSNIFAAAGEQFGGLDILINNAGVGGNALFLDEDPAVLRKIMEVNFFAVAECCRLGIPLLLRGEQPLIVNVSSMFGRRGVPNWSSYCASKFAVCGFSESLRAELAARMIDLMLVLPGVTRTEFGKNLLSGAPTNLASGLDAGRAAEAILSGIRQNRSEVRIGGDSKRLILLNRLFPRRLDRRMVHSARNVPEASGGNIAFSSAVAANGEKAINWRSLRARRVQSIRAAERLLPEPIFHAILFPFLSLKTLGRWRTDRKTLQMQRRLPESFNGSRTALGMLRARYRMLAIELIRHWPDRLRQPRWQRRCHLSGEEHLQASLATGRPLILMTVHYSNVRELIYWLRSRGLPLVTMVFDLYRDELRRYYDGMADVANGLRDIPIYCGTSLSDLHDIREFLSRPGNALMIVIDAPSGAHPATIEAGDVSVRIQLGGFSLAAITNAVVVPCLVRAGPRMQCDIRFGQPVPDELLSNRKSYPAAAKHVLDQLMPIVRQCPQQSDPLFFYAQVTSPRAPA